MLFYKFVCKTKHYNLTSNYFCKLEYWKILLNSISYLSFVQLRTLPMQCMEMWFFNLAVSLLQCSYSQWWLVVEFSLFGSFNTTKEFYFVEKNEHRWDANFLLEMHFLIRSVWCSICLVTRRKKYKKILDLTCLAAQSKLFRGLERKNFRALVIKKKFSECFFLSWR